MRVVGILCVLLLGGCARRQQLTVAAASNFTQAFDEIGRAFTEQTGVAVVFNYGATAALARQVAEGAPLDVFASADAEHAAGLVSQVTFAHGQLALWAPRTNVSVLQDLAGDDVKFIAIAQPELAPYGRAAVEALHAAGLWEAVQPKLVYANSVNQVKQLAATGNADAVFTAYSLVFAEAGAVIRVDRKLHAPLVHVAGLVGSSPRASDARRFLAFLTSARGRSILTQHGYLP